MLDSFDRSRVARRGTSPRDRRRDALMERAQRYERRTSVSNARTTMVPLVRHPYSAVPVTAAVIRITSRAAAGVHHRVRVDHQMFRASGRAGNRGRTPRALATARSRPPRSPHAGRPHGRRSAPRAHVRAVRVRGARTCACTRRVTQRPLAGFRWGCVQRARCRARSARRAVVDPIPRHASMLWRSSCRGDRDVSQHPTARRIHGRR